MIAQARADLTEVLESQGLKVYPYVPERLEAPCVIIDTAPRIESGEVFGEYAISFKVTAVVAPAGDFGIQVESLDALMDEVLEAVENLDVTAQGHYVLQAPDGQQMLAYEINIESDYRKEN
ncbi:hypothetical protein [uncultured Mobiluncus sp.]|uniref:hypothetical protein n=1 Tax=uncultured Mobiluncus sp. TaxID=293425 RepID=UPI00288B0CE6|nr:hypothetical protein [uncultured Mobiluncus sp.]